MQDASAKCHSYSGAFAVSRAACFSAVCGASAFGASCSSLCRIFVSSCSYESSMCMRIMFRCDRATCTSRGIVVVVAFQVRTTYFICRFTRKMCVFVCVPSSLSSNPKEE